jgi:hypothetical protein
MKHEAKVYRVAITQGLGGTRYNVSADPEWNKEALRLKSILICQFPTINRDPEGLYEGYQQYLKNGGDAYFGETPTDEFNIMFMDGAEQRKFTLLSGKQNYQRYKQMKETGIMAHHGKEYAAGPLKEIKIKKRTIN